MQEFLGLPIDDIEQAVADSEGDLEAAVDSLLQQAHCQPNPATPKQGLPQPQQQQPEHLPLQQNGHSPWQDTPTPSGWHPSFPLLSHAVELSDSSSCLMTGIGEQAVAGAPSPEGMQVVLVGLVQRHLLNASQSNIKSTMMPCRGRPKDAAALPELLSMAAAAAAATTPATATAPAVPAILPACAWEWLRHAGEAQPLGSPGGLLGWQQQVSPLSTSKTSRG